jgi:hypothetical protein
MIISGIMNIDSMPPHPTGKIEINFAVSLGFTCFSAEFLRKYKLRLAAYPFDWLYSHPQMIVDCLDNNFSNFLNKKYFNGDPGQNHCRHNLYDTSLAIFPYHLPPTFYHHNPLNQVDANYHLRCVGRFRNLLKKSGAKLFLITLINRSGPLESNVVNLIQRMKATIDRATPNSYVVVINCLSAGSYWKQPSKFQSIEYKSNRVTIINLVTSEIMGTQFSNSDDWTLYKSQLDNLFTFNLSPSPDCVKEKDPW